MKEINWYNQSVLEGGQDGNALVLKTSVRKD